MKKILTILIISLFFVSFASAIYNPNMEYQKNDSPQIMRVQNAEGEGVQATERVGAQNMERARIQAGDEMYLQNGDALMFRNMEGEGLAIESQGRIAECIGECNFTRNESRLQIRMSNGVNSEIKVMPNVASERALEVLRLKMCDNCTLELKEVRNRNRSQMAYEMKTEKRSRILGIFGSKMKVEAQIDAETGEVIRTKRPWWSFMATEQEEA